MGDVIEILTTATNTVEVEAQGPQGIPGVGVPTGGSALQVLRKKTSTDYDTEWAAAESGSGSVTSVALASTDLTITGSPITTSGTITANIAANAVTLEKLQTISSEHLLGRHGNGNGGVQQIGLGTGLAMSGSNVRVATTGITAGTYTKLTIDETGRATVGATATPSDIGAQSTLTEVNVDSVSQTSPHQLSGMSAQAVRIYTTEDFTIRLPQTNIQIGNIIEILASTLSATKTISIQRDQANGGGAWTTIASIASQGQKRKFVAIGTTANAWQEDSYFTTNGLIGAPAVHTHELTALAATGATNGHVLTANGSNGVTFAALPASGVTGAAASASDVLGVSGANITGVDANADRIVYWNNTSNKLAYGTPADAGAAAASHTHGTGDITGLAAIATSGSASDLGSGTVPIARLGASGTPSGSTYLAGDNTWKSVTGGVTAVGASTADVLSVSGSDLVADDGGTIDSADPFIKWDDNNSKLVYANPLSRPSGAFYVGLAPTSTALGTNSVNIQSGRDNAAHLAKDASSVCVGYGARSTSSLATSVGHNSSSGNAGAALGGTAVASNDAVGIGYAANGGTSATAVGRSADASGFGAVAIGYGTGATATNSTGIGFDADASLRGQFMTRPFGSVYWGGTTTDATANVELNLDATATNRMTIAANTMVVADLMIAANQAGVASATAKAMFCRRMVAIRRDNANSTVLVGEVQTVGNDQFLNAPTWSILIDSDDTNEALRVRVTGATSETVTWRVTAFYRVV